MSKRKRDDSGKGPTMKKAKTFNARSGYNTVPRTRGAYEKGEMKYFDVGATGPIPASADWTATEFDPTTKNTIFCPIVGSAINERIGKACNVHKLKFRGMISCLKQADQTGCDNAVLVRFILAQDKQTNSTQAQGEDVMMSNGSAVYNPHSFQNINNFGRFQVLKDKVFYLESPNATFDGTNVEQGGAVIPFKFTVNFKKPVVVRFNATNGGTVADIVDNSWHVYATCYDAGMVPNLTYVCRVCYKE